MQHRLGAPISRATLAKYVSLDMGQLHLLDRERMPLLPYLSGVAEKAFADHLLS
jgi:hypothetical protein